MTLLQIQEWLATIVASPFYYVGTNDKAREECIAVYNTTGAQPRIAIGGIANTGYQNKAISVLIRWGKNTDLAEQKANEVYSAFFGKVVQIGGKKVIFTMRQGQPITIGQDGEGNFEYVVEVLLNYEI